MTLLQIFYERNPQMWMLIAYLIGFIVLLVILVWYYFQPWKLFDYDGKDSRYCRQCASHQKRKSVYYYKNGRFVESGETYWEENSPGTKPDCQCRRYTLKR